MIRYKDKYILRRAEERDFPALVQMYTEVFDKRVSLDYFKRKYDTEYLRVKNLSAIALYNETPVAYYGILPQKFRRGNEEVLLAQLCDNITLPAHQRQGLNSRLAELTFEIMKTEGIGMAYALPNESSFPAILKMNWGQRGRFSRFHFAVRTLPLAKVLNRLNWNAVYDLFFEKGHETQFLRCFAASDKHWKQAVSSPFLAYKNKMHGHYFVRYSDCTFWIKIESIMHVGLCSLGNKESLGKALRKLKRKAALLGINEILFQVDPNSDEYQKLGAFAESKPSWPLVYKKIDYGLEIEDFVFTLADLDTF
ncbi:GNAT family N-acetyltransferase [Marinilongibacter aquaticus]|uniref:GNAT family N-acetyltransferase n=1 Tax=Marinilongibacter aquaticus TaxID=2975157 RepID=UPI0021BD100E|nr:GNAT family N-acetyltransferase [Marinilongibacter aquaticus]UBM59296.1 GNAT family N-acetyltransferase [Marinilongibacter aquaticus]